MGRKMKTINVVAAIIRSINEFSEPVIYATQRGYGDMKGGWEFPGGKVEEGEEPEEALKREIMEELQTEISVDSYIDTVEYDYPKFHLSMRCYFCSIISGELTLLEAQDAKWLSKEELYSVDWLPADLQLIEKVQLSFDD